MTKVYRDAKIRMSTKSMADFLYAVIMTHAEIPVTFGVGIYEYDRKVNSRHMVEVKIGIEESRIKEFEQISGCALKLPISVTVNDI